MDSSELLAEKIRSNILVQEEPDYTESIFDIFTGRTDENPGEILEWIFSHGVDQTLISYNFDPDEFRKTVTQGTIQINKLTTKLINQISSNSGHQELFSNLLHMDLLVLGCSFDVLLRHPMIQ